MRTLFVTDLDGTLLDNSSAVSTTSARLLNESIARGALFTVATARTPATVAPLLREVTMRLPGVVMTGGALYDFSARRLFDARFMDPATARRLAADWEKSRLGAFMYNLDPEGILDVYHIGPLSDVQRSFMQERDGTPSKRFHVPADGRSQLPSDHTRTMLFFGMAPQEPGLRFFNEVKERYGEAIIPQWYHDLYGPSIVEIEMFPAGVDKASAVERVASMTGADRLVVFGDNINDLPMMRIADEAVAVGNAHEQVKEAATAVIGANDTDAVARFIKSET